MGRHKKEDRVETTNECDNRERSEGREEHRPQPGLQQVTILEEGMLQVCEGLESGRKDDVLLWFEQRGSSASLATSTPVTSNHPPQSSIRQLALEHVETVTSSITAPYCLYTDGSLQMEVKDVEDEDSALNSILSSNSATSRTAGRNNNMRVRQHANLSPNRGYTVSRRIAIT
ncbi:hypothetical protein Pcinc_002408 [Petrolisthes cinctipes]|uniref:Uncharacterized protein n=1 Tax=Petrolisthes cinctipes TaxID=88211 RepID=A0AAE1GKZ7_PETCI|nr:hypothetical protein Pcinc_002408 [Petrolisthes cinctipes]